MNERGKLIRYRERGWVYDWLRMQNDFGTARSAAISKRQERSALSTLPAEPDISEFFRMGREAFDDGESLGGLRAKFKDRPAKFIKHATAGWKWQHRQFRSRQATYGRAAAPEQPDSVLSAQAHPAPALTPRKNAATLPPNDGATTTLDSRRHQ